MFVNLYEELRKQRAEVEDYLSKTDYKCPRCGHPSKALVQVCFYDHCPYAADESYLGNVKQLEGSHNG